MRTASFIYTDKDNFKYPFTMEVMNIAPQLNESVTLKQLNISKRKLFELVGKNFNAKQDYKDPIVTFDGWKEQEQYRKPIGILDISPDELPLTLLNKLFDHKPYTYMDTSDLLEHLYAPETIVEKFQENAVILNGEESKALDDMQQNMNTRDCGYFRIVVN